MYTVYIVYVMLQYTVISHKKIVKMEKEENIGLVRVSIDFPLMDY